MKLRKLVEYHFQIDFLLLKGISELWGFIFCFLFSKIKERESEISFVKEKSKKDFTPYHISFFPHKIPKYFIFYCLCHIQKSKRKFYFFSLKTDVIKIAFQYNQKNFVISCNFN